MLKRLCVVVACVFLGGLSNLSAIPGLSLIEELERLVAQGDAEASSGTLSAEPASPLDRRCIPSPSDLVASPTGVSDPIESPGVPSKKVTADVIKSRPLVDRNIDCTAFLEGCFSDLAEIERFYKVGGSAQWGLEADMNAYLNGFLRELKVRRNMKGPCLLSALYLHRVFAGISAALADDKDHYAAGHAYFCRYQFGKKMGRDILREWQLTLAAMLESHGLGRCFDSSLLEVGMSVHLRKMGISGPTSALK